MVIMYTLAQRCCFLFSPCSISGKLATLHAHRPRLHSMESTITCTVMPHTHNYATRCRVKLKPPQPRYYHWGGRFLFVWEGFQSRGWGWMRFQPPPHNLTIVWNPTLSPFLQTVSTPTLPEMYWKSLNQFSMFLKSVGLPAEVNLLFLYVMSCYGNITSQH